MVSKRQYVRQPHMGVSIASPMAKEVLLCRNHLSRPVKLRKENELALLSNCWL
jgi:hypothetical protein